MTELIFMFLLVCKHAVADLALQSRLEYKGGKLNLKNGRLLIHCAHHAVLAFLVAIIFVGIINALWILLFDFIAHFVIDYSKSWYQSKTNVKYGTKTYWIYSTVDQILHYTTYFIIVIFAV